jgi:hypothetical protein
VAGVVLLVVVAPKAVEEVVLAKIDEVVVTDEVVVVLVLLVVVVVTWQNVASSSDSQLSNWLQHARYSPDSGEPLSVQLSRRNRQFALRQKRWQNERATKSTPQLRPQFR